MAIVKTIKGDLIKLFKAGNFQAIAHGANCKNLMGAGIARQIAAQLPEAFQADAEFYTRMGGSDNKPCPNMAGQLSVAHAEQGQVFNLYTQVQTGRHAEYQLLQTACENLNKFCKQRSITRVGVPLIGAGIGGLDILAVMTIINACTPDIDVTVVVWEEDDVAWKVTKRFTNYGFPRKFDGVVVRDSQTGFNFLTQYDKGLWSRTTQNLADLRMIYENGEYALSLGEDTPAVWLVIPEEHDFEENKNRLY